MNGAQFRTCLDAMFSFPFISPIRDIPGGGRQSKKTFKP